MEVAEETTTEQNTSMEELKMDEDENIKEISMEEDILGAQSLLMSESDDDDGIGLNSEGKKQKSPRKKISPKRTKRIQDSDDENNGDKQEEQHHIDQDDEEEIGNKKSKKKVSALIDSDSENETENKQKNRNKKIIDSESENEGGDKTTDLGNIESDDQEELVFKDNTGILDITAKKLKKNKKLYQKSKEEDNSDDTDNEQKKKSKKVHTKNSDINENRKKTQKKSKKSLNKLIDSDSDTEVNKAAEQENLESEEELVFKDNFGVIDVPYSKSKKSKKQIQKPKEDVNSDTERKKKSKKIQKVIEEKKSDNDENSDNEKSKTGEKHKKSSQKKSKKSRKDKIDSETDNEIDKPTGQENEESDEELVFKDNVGVLDISSPTLKISKKQIKKSKERKNSENSDIERKKKSKKLQKITMQEDSENGNSDTDEKPKKSSQKKSKKSMIKDSSDSETSENENIKSKKKVSSLVDSDSSDSESRSGYGSEMDLDASARAANFENNNNDEEHKGEGKDKKTKVMRASAKKALDEMQAIQSEQQRLHREANISIPYHKPKKHTLQEFLKRRTVIQPKITLQNSTPKAAAGQIRRIKMTAEEMEEYAKLMEERAKEAKEFFKSESEDEEDNAFKENSGILDKSTEQENTEVEKELTFNYNNVMDTSTTEQVEKPSQDTPDLTREIDNPNQEDKENLDGVQLTEDELAELLAEEQVPQEPPPIEERPTCSRVMITEIIELPKLDMNTVKISPVKKHTPRSSLNETNLLNSPSLSGDPNGVIDLETNDLSTKKSSGIEALKQRLLNEKNISGRPSLSGDPNKLIDLETGDLIEKKPSGIENLMQRLMSSNKVKKSKNSEICSILSTENGKLEMTKVNVSLTESNDPNKEPKPGAAYFELKKNLKEIIKKKRLEEMHKKQEDELEHSKCLADDDDEEEQDEEMELDEYEPDAKPKNKVIVVDDEENALEVEDDEEEEEYNEDDDNEANAENNEEVNNEDDNPDVIKENDENDDEEDEDENDDDDDDEENDIETKDEPKRKNRIIKAFDDSEEEGDRDDIDFLKTQPPPTQLPNFDDTQNSVKGPFVDPEDELMGLCSGTFDATQKTASNALMSQIPLTQNNGKTVDDEELMDLCSGTFETQQLPIETQQTTTQPKKDEVINFHPKSNKILSSDEEEKEEEEEKTNENKERVKKLTKKLKKKKAKLGFSDDEDEDDDDEEKEEDEEEIDEEEDLEPAVEEPETFVDYDSEENEILVQMTKKDKVKQAANFFEKEAQLSESEWGSADEDENNLDKYDIELGDEDEFDGEKIQRELGQIHARKMLDEDLREVRKIQEMLFEDEEKDGIGRQRTFKWKNAENGFSLDDGQRDENADGENGDSGDEINEHQWRKIRYEREQFLKEQGLKPGSQDMSTTLPNTTIQSMNNTTIAAASSSLTTKKLHIITAKKTSAASTSDSKKSSPFLISKGISAMHKKSVRGSFLVRDKETLNKLAGLTKGSSSSATASDMGDTAGTVSIKSVKAKNFVFATLTEEEHENLKRKADDLLNSSNENGTNFMKKRQKIEPRRDKCFIDQLL